MRIVIIGASGTAGRAVTQALSRKHEVVRVGCTQGDYQVDIASQESAEALFEKIGRVDTIVSVADNPFFGPLSIMTNQDLSQELQDKLLGQIRLALAKRCLLNDGGSIALISGIIAHEPIAQGTNATAINAGLGGFIRAAACELDHGQRISLISPTMLNEPAEAYDGFFPGFESMPTTTIANTYRRSVEGIQAGCIYRVSY